MTSIVRPVRVTELPPVSRQNGVLAFAAAVRLGAAPRPITVRLPPFGQVSILSAGITAPTPPEDLDVVWSLSRDKGDGRSGFLVIAGLNAVRLVSATLGLPAPRIPRALGAAERGIVSATIAGLLRLTAPDATLALARPRWRADDLVRVRVDADLGGFTTKALLDIPPEWIPPRSRQSMLRDMISRDLALSLRIELVRTTLEACDWAGVTCGDAIVVDEEAFPSVPDGDWAIRLVCGQFAAKARMSADGQLKVLTAFESDGTVYRRTVDTNPTWRHIMSNDNPSPGSLAMLAAAPIEVVAEIGRIILRAEEAAVLCPGSILEFGSLRPNTVDVRVGDHTWARGELVDVDGHLGVRITAMAPRTERSTSDEADTAR